MASCTSANEILKTIMNGIRNRTINQAMGMPSTRRLPACALNLATALPGQHDGAGRVPGQINGLIPCDAIVRMTRNVGDRHAESSAARDLHEIDGHVAHVSYFLDDTLYDILARLWRSFAAEVDFLRPDGNPHRRIRGRADSVIDVDHPAQFLAANAHEAGFILNQPAFEHVARADEVGNEPGCREFI